MSHQNCRIKSAVILYLLSSPPGFTRSLVLCVMFSRSLFVVLYVFFWPLCCLFFSELRLPVTSLVSPSSSYMYSTQKNKRTTSEIILRVLVANCVQLTLNI